MLQAGLVIFLRLARAGRHLWSTKPQLSQDNSILTLIIFFPPVPSCSVSSSSSAQSFSSPPAHPLPFSRQSWQGLSHWSTIQRSSRASFPLIFPPSVCSFHLLWPVTTPHKRFLFAFPASLWPSVDSEQMELRYMCCKRIKWELLSHLSVHVYHLSQICFGQMRCTPNVFLLTWSSLHIKENTHLLFYLTCWLTRFHLICAALGDL